MMKQPAKSKSNIIFDNEYGLWFPNGIDEWRLNIISRHIHITKESSDKWILYIGNKRIRTSTESSSHPCFNCGHCIDNGLDSCSNRGCVRDRVKRGLCDNGFRGFGSRRGDGKWLHSINRKYVYHKKKKGVLYEQSMCKNCNKYIRWLAEYPYDQHIIDYLKSTIKPKVNNKSIMMKTLRKSRGAYGKLRHLVYKYDNYKCRECGATKEEISLEIDHIVPWSKGGLTELGNLQTLCKNCNRSKHTREWVGGQ